MEKDVVIIGSGLGGLECALMLARQGKKVLVLERQQHPGGCMQSYHRRGNAYDTGLHYVGGLDEGQPLYDVFKELGLLDLPWKRLDPNGFDEITICGKTYRFKEGYEHFMDELAKDFPEEREGLKKYVEILQTKDEQWLQKTNAWEYLTNIIHDPLLISVISGASLKMELKKDTLPLFTFAHGNASFIESSWRLKGPGNLIVKKLINQIRENGGDVICGADVTDLIEEYGKITKAICLDGREFEAKTFISDIHPAMTLCLVKDSKNIRNIFRKRISALDNTYGMFTLQLRLKQGQLHYFNHNKFVYNQEDVWDNIAVSTTRPSVRGIMISCPVPMCNDNADDNVSAEVLDILTPMEWDYVAQWADKEPGHRGENYVEMKKEISRQCISLAETLIPGLASMIESEYTSTPLTYYTYCNAPGGTAYGVRKDSNNPLGTILSPSTPISNLLMTGQSLMLHGLHGVSMTAKYTIKNISQ